MAPPPPPPPTAGRETDRQRERIEREREALWAGPTEPQWTGRTDLSTPHTDEATEPLENDPWFHFFLSIYLLLLFISTWLWISMAEARREEEQEGERRDLRDVRTRNQTTGMFGKVPGCRSCGGPIPEPTNGHQVFKNKYETEHFISTFKRAAVDLISKSSVINFQRAVFFFLYQPQITCTLHRLAVLFCNSPTILGGIVFHSFM